MPILFAWATSRDRAGAYRRYAVASLIRLEKEELYTHGNPKLDIEKLFIEWVDDSVLENAGKHTSAEESSHKPTRGASSSLEDTCRLLEELVRQDVLSFSLYMQRMIARGETEPRRDGVSQISSLGSETAVRLTSPRRRPRHRNLQSICSCSDPSHYTKLPVHLWLADA